MNLAMNPLESFDSLATLFPRPDICEKTPEIGRTPCDSHRFPSISRLLVLDVSFTELSDTGAWYALAELPRLRRLIAEGCNIASLEDMEPLKALESLAPGPNQLLFTF